MSNVMRDLSTVNRFTNNFMNAAAIQKIYRVGHTLNQKEIDHLNQLMFTK